MCDGEARESNQKSHHAGCDLVVFLYKRPSSRCAGRIVADNACSASVMRLLSFFYNYDDLKTVMGAFYLSSRLVFVCILCILCFYSGRIKIKTGHNYNQTPFFLPNTDSTFHPSISGCRGKRCTQPMYVRGTKQTHPPRYSKHGLEVGN